MHYRPEIDGLRTLAVMPVILYHAGVSWLPGGFVGVDVFFVISGYLISSIIYREVQAGEFSFLRFYERRLRRIIPALLVMVLVTVSVFQGIALPEQAKVTAEAGIAALLSLSNFYFWSESGYFVPKAEFLPLLHTWSLAVEEQFYLIFPLILIAMMKLWPCSSIKWIFLMGTAIAFLAGYWLSINTPSAAFYLLPARAWELAVGASLALGAVPEIRGALLREIGSAVGIGMILFSLFWIRSEMIFPGWVAMIPCIGTALVIHAGGQSWVARHLLSPRPMVFFGLLSYSLYLWHWPVLTALRIRSANVHLELVVAMWAIALTFLLAWLSWLFIEKPFRNSWSMPQRRMLTLLGIGCCVVLVIALSSVVTKGFPARLSKFEQVALDAINDIDPLRGPCENVHDITDCRFGKLESPVTYAIIGDSHAAAIRPAIEASGIMGNETGTLFWSKNCPLLDGAELLNHSNRAACAAFKQSVWELIETHPSIQSIIIAARWPFHFTGTLPETGGSYHVWLVDDETETPSTEENAVVLKRSLGRTISRLTLGGLNVIIIGAIPEPGFDVPITIAMSRYAGIEAPRGVPRDLVSERASAADSLLAEIVEMHKGVRFIPILDEFCRGTWCDIERDGVPIYHDDDHLSFEGAVGVAAAAIRHNR